MKRAFKSRKDLDDEPAPAFVMEPTGKVPICVRCGRDVPRATSLYTFCEYCLDADMPKGEALLKHPQGPKALIADLAKRMVASLPDMSPRGEVLTNAIVSHMDRLKRRGLSDHMALRQAEALVADPAHRASCSICTEDKPWMAQDES